MQHQPWLSSGNELTLAAVASTSKTLSSGPTHNNQGKSKAVSYTGCTIVFVASELKQAACMLHNQGIISIHVTNVTVPFPDILWQRQGSPGWHGK